MKALNLLLALAILATGGAATYFFATTAGTVAVDAHGEHGGEGEEGGEHAEGERGPHNGRMLESEALDLEITIFESGVEPEFRVYPYRHGEPVPLEPLRLSIDLHRFGGRTDTIEFQPQEDYLRGQQTVEEPHSFEVEVRASVQGKVQTWIFESFEGRAQMSAEAARQAGVETTVAGPAQAIGTLSLPGTIGLNRDRVAHIVPRLSGVARAVHKSLGDDVKNNEVLAIIDSKELADAKSAYLASHERRALAQARFDVEKELYGKKVSPEQDYVEARQALAETDISVRTARQKLLALGLSEEALAETQRGGGSSLTQYELRSPFEGTVIEKHLALGEAVKEDSDCFVLADLSSVWAEIVVYAADLKRVRIGQAVSVHSADLGATAKGSISYIGDIVGETTRAARAIVDLPNPDRIWKPGLYVNVKIAEGETEFPVAVPEGALQSIRDWTVVFLTDGVTYQAQPVALGRKVGGWAEVLSGLEPGDTYVSANSYLIKADIEKSGASHDH